MTDINLAIKLDNDGDIATKETEGGGIDYDVIDGKNATAQGLEISLKTRQGEDPISPHIGLPIPKIIGIFNPDFVAGTVRWAILQDPRIKEVNVEANPRSDEDRQRRVLELDIYATTIRNEEISEILEVTQ